MAEKGPRKAVLQTSRRLLYHRAVGKPADRSPLGRLAVTLGLASVALGLAHVPLPGLDPWVLGEVDRRVVSIGALGVLPVVNAFVIVEFAALLRPSWRRLRVSGPVGRAPLTRAAHAVALGLAAFQAFGITMYLEGVALWGGSAVMSPGWGFRLSTICTLVGATALLIVIAGAIQRLGVGNGYSVLMASTVCQSIVSAVGQAFEREPAVRFGALSIVVAILALTGLVLSTPWQSTTAAPREPYRVSAEPTAVHPIVRVLPAGIIPLLVATSLLAMPNALQSVFGDAAAAPVLSGAAYEVLGIAAVIAFTVLFSRLFQSPERVARLRARVLGTGALGSDPDRVRSELAKQVAFAAPLLCALWWAGSWLWETALLDLQVVTVVVLAAVVLDVSHELRVRQRLGRTVAVGAIHRVYATDVALDLLRREGIAAEPRTLYHRQLVQFFGPYLPIELLVAKKDAKLAAELLAKLAEPDGDEPENATAHAEPEAPRKRRRRKRAREASQRHEP